MFGTSISPSDRNAREAASKQAIDFLYGRSNQTTFSWNLYDQRSANAGISSVGGFIPGFTAPFTGRCATSTDCGQGFFCDQGICRPVGTGNTATSTDGGCSTGPNENDGISSDTCGSRSGTGNLGGCSSPGCGAGGPGDCNGGGRCCRFTATSITCSNGRCSEPGDGRCTSYCSGYRSSYGSTGPGCSSSNTCSECADCINNNCVPKTSGAPCHCNPKAGDNCGRPDTPLTCCNFKDTCEGRVYLPNGQRYCHATYRVGVPRCFDPTVSCDGPQYDPGCTICENRTHTRLSGEPAFVLPDGCKQTGFIRNEDTGEEKYLYQCCDSSECDDGAFDPASMLWWRPSFRLYRWFGPNVGYNMTDRTNLSWIPTSANRSVVTLWDPYDSPVFAGGARSLVNNLNSQLYFDGLCNDQTSPIFGCGAAFGVDVYLTVNGGYGDSYTNGAATISANRYPGQLAGWIEGELQYTNNTALGPQYVWRGNPG